MNKKDYSQLKFKKEKEKRSSKMWNGGYYVSVF